MEQHRKPNRPHWSYSQLSQYLRCPLQYYFERILKLPRSFLPSGMAFGSAVHQSLAEYHRELQLGRSMTPDQMQAVFLQAWHQISKDRPLQYRDGESSASLADLGICLLETYLKQPPAENIVGVEMSLLVPLTTSKGKILEKPLVALIDLLSREEAELQVTDFKTSGRKLSQGETDSSLQATFYALAVQERFDEQASIGYTVFVKTKTPKIQQLATARNESDFQRLGDLFGAVGCAIEAEAFYPIESAFNCSGCAYYKPCRQWQGTARNSEAVSQIEVVLN